MSRIIDRFREIEVEKRDKVGRYRKERERELGEEESREIEEGGGI